MDDPDFLDRQYEVPSLTESLTDVLVDPGVVGVARFIELPSFEAERLFTFVHRPTLIQESRRFDPGQAWRQSSVCAAASWSGRISRVKNAEPGAAHLTGAGMLVSRVNTVLQAAPAGELGVRLGLRIEPGRSYDVVT